MIITSTGKTIKIEAESVRILGKNARGVRIVNIDPPDYVNGLDKVIQEKPENDETVDQQENLVIDQSIGSELPEIL